MSIDSLPEKVKLPFDLSAIESGDPKSLAVFFRVFVTELERVLSSDISATVNLLVDTNNVQWRYFAAPDPASGAFAVGTFRMGQTDSGIEVQEQVSAGAWTKRTRITG